MCLRFRVSKKKKKDFKPSWRPNAEVVRDWERAVKQWKTAITSELVCCWCPVVAGQHLNEWTGPKLTQRVQTVRSWMGRQSNSTTKNFEELKDSIHTNITSGQRTLTGCKTLSSHTFISMIYVWVPTHLKDHSFFTDWSLVDQSVNCYYKYCISWFCN